MARNIAPQCLTASRPSASSFPRSAYSTAYRSQARHACTTGVCPPNQQAPADLVVSLLDVGEQFGGHPLSTASNQRDEGAMKVLVVRGKPLAASDLELDPTLAVKLPRNPREREYSDDERHDDLGHAYIVARGSDS